jgi:hypothetical protein
MYMKIMDGKLCCGTIEIPSGQESKLAKVLEKQGLKIVEVKKSEYDKLNLAGPEEDFEPPTVGNRVL